MNSRRLLNEIKEADKTTYEHSVRCGNYLAVFAEKCGKNKIEAQEYREAGYLHDAGKLNIMKYIKSSVNVRNLNPEERKDYTEALSMHVKYSSPLLKNLSDIKQTYLDAAFYHHCYYNDPNKGYSIETVKKEKNTTPIKSAIPEVAQMLAIVDVYDAITDPNRTYREDIFTDEKIKNIMDKGAENGHFNPVLYQKFKQEVLPAIKNMSEGEKLDVKITSDEKRNKLDMLGLGSSSRRMEEPTHIEQENSARMMFG